MGRGLPKFGPFMQKRWELQSAECSELLASSHLAGGKYTRPESEPAPVKTVTIGNVIGRALNKIGNWNDFDLKQQVVAVVDEELCINCGKCCTSWGSLL